MANIITDEWVEETNRYLRFLDTLDLHEKITLYLQWMEKFASEGQALLNHKLLTINKEEEDTLSAFIETFFEELSMFKDNDLPSEYPFTLSEQDLKDNFEVIYDSIKAISTAFCNVLIDLEGLRSPDIQELFQQMKRFVFIDRGLFFEMDNLEYYELYRPEQ
jgi:hypothetical protein